MQVFISFSHEDQEIAAKLEQALRRQNIEAWSALDLRSGQDWNRAVDEASAKADGFIFLVDAEASSNPTMLTEWRNVLRNDWESKKPLIPIVTTKPPSEHGLPPFLRNRRLLFPTNFEALVDQVVYLLEHPAETRDRSLYEQAKQDHNRRLEEIKEFALALKNDNDFSESGAERR